MKTYRNALSKILNCSERDIRIMIYIHSVYIHDFIVSVVLPLFFLETLTTLKS